MEIEASMTDEKKSDELEGNKLDHDTYKHLTTLSTGAILILATLLEKFFQHPEWKFLIGITLVSLIVSTIASVAAMFSISYDVSSGTDSNESSLVFSGITIVLSCGGFLLGIIAFVIFTLKNFF